MKNKKMNNKTSSVTFRISDEAKDDLEKACKRFSELTGEKITVSRFLCDLVDEWLAQSKGVEQAFITYNLTTLENSAKTLASNLEHLQNEINKTRQGL